MEYKLKIKEDTKPVEVTILGENSLNAVIDEKNVDVGYSLISGNHIHLTVNGKGMNVYVTDGPEGKSVVIDGMPYIVQDADAVGKKSKKSGVGGGPTEVTPVTPSVVISVLVKVGDIVQKGKGVIVLSAMKMEITLNAPYNGTVTGINAAEGDTVSPGQILVDIEKDEESSGEE
ncbi:hypothetical protein KKA14_10030 [bacterium]|nr:hypothetical protein [bacterium]